MAGWERRASERIKEQADDRLGSLVMESARVREKGDISSSRGDKKAQKRRGKAKKEKGGCYTAK